ncbi:ATP-binding protein [Treponema ruminis]|uniref:Putative transcriptional regulator n=1 Tax=Treponema ruminis TaxID=744515 RepID=A0A7W8G7G1_9SPIR|nr:ATP-binding protein [Treponema ruminis]MBB5225134.1 putative transcriptional regulator [Treponema ruminis]QSI01055.1 ATP-binding protein [Treponema ruminis]
MAKNNPFTLSFGKSPNEIISRYEFVNDIIDTFQSENPISNAYLIEGLRGTGKTVLMTTIEKELEKENDWIIVDLNSTQDLLTDFAMRLVDSCKNFSDIFKKGFNLSIAGFGIGLNGENQSRDSVSIICEILESLRKKNKKVLITIDEVMNGENMRHFASEFQILLRKDFSVFLLMTGLYENIYSIQNDPALTFLLRTPKIKLEPLSLAQITKTYQKVFETDLDMSKKLAKTTKGYAFAFQALGLLYFDYKDSLSLEKILLKFDDLLDDFVYRKIWQGLSEQDKNVILAITDSKTQVSEVCKKLNMTSSTFSKYRQRLLEKGIIQAPQHGYVEIVLPRFAEVSKYYVE